MVYTNKLVAVVVTSGGKICREIRQDGSDQVFMPFGSEYSLRFKNMDSRRCVVTSIEIDGENVLDGKQLVIDARTETELEGFLNGRDNVAKNKFKFIKKTDKISKHRGDRIDDGLIRIEFQFEEPIRFDPPKIVRDKLPWERPRDIDQKPWRPNPYDIRYKATRSVDDNSAQCFSCSTSQPQPSQDPGITVAGSQINQKFGTTTVGRLSPDKSVIVIQLRGEDTSGAPVNTPRTTRSRVQCPTCGDKHRSSAKFCSGCGTGLV